MIHHLGQRLISDHPTPQLLPIAANIWTIEANSFIYYRPPAQPRYPYPHRAVVIRLQDNELFVLSPIALDSNIQATLNELGIVRYLVSPNNIHHVYMGSWSEAYPEAKLYASPGLESKRKDLTFETTLSSDISEPAWEGQIDQCLFKSWAGWLDELILFHRESRTVIFTDLIMDFDPETFSKISRVTTAWNDMYRHTPRTMQIAYAFGRDPLRSILTKIRDWEPEHLIVAHSPWQCIDGQQEVAEFLDHAFDWLEPKGAIAEITTGVFQVSLLFLGLLPIHLLLVLVLDLPQTLKRSHE